MSSLREVALHTLNCHQHTDTSDLLGSLRPIRGKDQIGVKLRSLIVSFLEEGLRLIDGGKPRKKSKKKGGKEKVEEEEEEEGGKAVEREVVEALVAGLKGGEINLTLLSKFEGVAPKMKRDYPSLTSFSPPGSSTSFLSEIKELIHSYRSLFGWEDGPVVKSMKDGGLFLMDEISLAEDSVLERMNSVLEPSRTLVLPEKGGRTVCEMTAHPSFRVVATMNPGGDFGKRELSPALRNRFTEIWVANVSDRLDLGRIIRERLTIGKELGASLSERMLDFVEWVRKEGGVAGGVGKVWSVRDLLAWVEFLNRGVGLVGEVDEVCVHGAFLVMLDGIGTTGSGVLTPAAMKSLLKESVEFLISHLPEEQKNIIRISSGLDPHKRSLPTYKPSTSSPDKTLFGIAPFFVECGGKMAKRVGGVGGGDGEGMVDLPFSFSAPTTSRNVSRLLRGYFFFPPPFSPFIWMTNIRFRHATPQTITP